MAEKGHQLAFLRPRLSARYQFSQGTLAGTRGNGRDAPICRHWGNRELQPIAVIEARSTPARQAAPWLL